MKFNLKSLTILFLLIAILSACGGAPTEEQLSNDDAVMTLAVGTMVAGFFGSQTAAVTATLPSTNTPLPTNTFPPVPTPVNTQPPLPVLATPTFGFFYTATPGNLLTPSVTGTLPTATFNYSSVASGCNNSAFIRDVNYPSGTTVSAGENFVKTWKVQNIGTCDWQYNYGMSVVVDNDFDSSWNHLGRNVSPGDWAEVSVIVTAPDHDGTFTGSWRIADASGTPFGVTLTLSIVVP